MIATRKRLGQFFTPADVAATLVRWVVDRPGERMLDPSCGDGRFLECHCRSVGVEFDPANSEQAKARAPWALVHTGDFFRWSSETKERFEVIAGNPPFIRYQSFKGEIRGKALAAASMMGANFSSLTSSWAPFVIVAAGLLKPGGKMGFVVPAEIAHAGYARELIPALCDHFDEVRLVAYREKLFPDLSEDCWLLVCRGYGGKSRSIHLSTRERFAPEPEPPLDAKEISLTEWSLAGGRLRPYLLPSAASSLYFSLLSQPGVHRHSELASSSIGYVTGANDFFHLRPSEAEKLAIPSELLKVAVRKSEQLPQDRITRATVDRWIAEDRPVLLLDLKGQTRLPDAVARYLDSAAGHEVRKAYKCRVRKPWYGVPDVKVPHAFLSVMCGREPTIVGNEARCVGTNSLHAVTLRNPALLADLLAGWRSPLARLGAELEGHSLGGGMLKLEPSEAGRVPVPMLPLKLAKADQAVLDEAIVAARSWRHHA